MKVKGWKSMYHVNAREKKARVRILISDTTGFKTKTGTRHKEGHYMILKQTIDKNIQQFKYLCTQHGSTQIHKAAVKNQESNQQ